jgi:putative DNA primase/helicase
MSRESSKGGDTLDDWADQKTKGKQPDTPPLDVAREAQVLMWERLVRWQSQFFAWRSGAYRMLSDDAVRASLYSHLEVAGHKATRARVTDVLDALRAVAFIGDDVEPPCRLETGAPPATGLVACANGILNMRTGELGPADPEFFTLSALEVGYDPQAKAPAWDEFLDAVFGEDVQSRDCLQEIFGYVVSLETALQKIFLIIGPRRGGKGTILRVLTRLIGRASTAAVTLSSLEQPFGLQPLIGKALATVSDARLGGRADQSAITERLLSVSGEDHQGVARKFLPAFTAQLGARFVIATNEVPRLQDTSGALAGRFVPVVLENSFYGREDPGLTDRLLQELPGILVWSMAGYRRLVERGRFAIPEKSIATIEEIHDLSSPVGAFVRERCVVEVGAEVACGHIYEEWKSWCEEHGRSHPGTEQTFGRDLRAAVPGIGSSRPTVAGSRVRVYRGLRLATAAVRPAAAPDARGPGRTDCVRCDGNGCGWCT